jgi:hypothetical protein
MTSAVGEFLSLNRFLGPVDHSVTTNTPLTKSQIMGRHCADNNTGAQRYLFSGRFQISGDRGTQLLRAIRSREDHSDEKITHHEVGWSPWSPVRNHPVNVQGGQVSDWEESQVLAALAVSELSAAVQ